MRVLSTLLDFLFPPREAEKTVRNLLLNKVILSINAAKVSDTFYLLSYGDERVRALINENKFYQNENAALVLSKHLQRWVDEQNTAVTFIPIPLSKKRRKERGYNQVTEVVKRLTSKNVKVFNSVLVRNKHTTPQTDLNKTDRQKNVRGAFLCNKPELLKEISGTLVVLIDDVITTGSTINEARATLAPHLPKNTKLITLALAH